MSSLADELAADLADAIGGYEQTFDWNGLGGIPCVRRNMPSGADVQEAGGLILNADYVLIVSKASFPNGLFPQTGDLVNDSTAQIKLISGDEDPATPELLLHIGSVDAE